MKRNQTRVWFSQKSCAAFAGCYVNWLLCKWPSVFLISTKEWQQWLKTLVLCFFLWTAT